MHDQIGIGTSRSLNSTRSLCHRISLNLHSASSSECGVSRALFATDNGPPLRNSNVSDLDEGTLLSWHIHILVMGFFVATAFGSGPLKPMVSVGCKWSLRHISWRSTRQLPPEIEELRMVTLLGWRLRVVGLWAWGVKTLRGLDRLCVAIMA